MKKYALVCGASGEIGTAICQHLAQQGWSLYVHYASKPTTELVGKLSAAFPQQEFLVYRQILLVQKLQAA